LFGNFDKQDRTTESGSASWWVTFMDALCHLPYPKEACHQRLIAELRNYYDGKTEELHVIGEFERDYTPEKAIWWYTRDTFFFRLINKANRQHNVAVMFAFGYYIRDLFVQLKKEHEIFKVTNADNVQVKVFRGQIMSEDEVETLKSAYMVRLTSFLSTSLDRRLALSFLPLESSVANGHVRVLIEINLNAKYNSKPFGNISHLSEFSGESEVLMMIGTFLRVRQTYYSEEDKMVKSIMTLEKDYILPFENRYMSLKECVSIIAAEVCRQAPEEEINIIFDELNELFASEREWLRAERYRTLGGCQKGYSQKNYRSALQYYKQALAAWQIYPEDSSVEIGNLYLEIGRLYNDHLEDEELAQKHYESAITVCKTTLSHLQDDERQKATLYQILSMVYLDKAEMNDQNEEQKTALHYEKLRLQTLLKLNSPINRELGLCYTSIGELQEQMSLFDEALGNYKEIVKVYIAQDDTEALSRTYQRISRIYEDHLKDLSSALKYRLFKHDAIVRSSEILPFHDCQEIEDRKHCVIQSHIQLADIHLRLHNFETARINLAAAKQLYEDMDWQKQAKNIEEQLSDIDRLEQNSR
jgi:tetratricopeptide (TPR) repeat protein